MYDLHKIDDGNCPAFELALPRDKGEYTRWLSNLTQNTDVALFALDYLGGSGTLIDVGANVGAICTPVAVAGSNVIAVEMLPENFLHLTLTALHNKLANMRLFQLAAGEDRGITHYSGSEAWGHVVSGANGLSAIMLPLDDIIDLSLMQAPDFVRLPILVKIDTEGYEIHVLRGARRLIESFEPAFFVECIMVEGRNAGPDLNTIGVKNFLEENGYHLYLQRGDRLFPRAASDIQEGHVADFFASKRKYRRGERIGRFTVSALEFEERIDWIEEMVEFPVAWHRMHAAGVLARWLAEERESPRIAALMHRLMEDQEPDVAAFAGQMLQNVGLDSPTKRQPGMEGPSYHFTANDVRLHTAVGIRENNAIRVTEAQGGAILYGPYISLPAGRYEAVIHFDPDVPCHGTAVMDACSDIGTNLLAQKIITAEEILDGEMLVRLEFSCQSELSMLEIRLFCAEKFAGAVRSVDILGKISGSSSQENVAYPLIARSSTQSKVRESHSDFPALFPQHFQNAKLFANREDMISSMHFLKGGMIAEVGVAHGEFSEFLFKELDPSKFVAIDVFTMHEYPVAWGVPTAVLFDGMSHLDFYKRRFAKHGPRIVTEVGLSHDALAKYPEKSFDLIYIDAGHDYENVKQDAELSTQKLKNSGVIVFNDYIMYDHISGVPYGVVQAVNELVVNHGWKVWGFALQQHMFCDIAIRRPICSP